MYISFVIVGIRYGTGRHHVDLSEHDILIAIKVCTQTMRIHGQSHAYNSSIGISANGLML